MKTRLCRSLQAFAALALPLAAALTAGTAAAQVDTSRPVRFIVPFGPGGANDMVMRALSGPLAKELGQAVVVENRAGAGSTVGLNALAKSPADGYHFGLASLPFGANPYVYAKLPYDTEKDFAPVTLLAKAPLVVAVHPSLPARSIKELIDLARSKPLSINYGSAGNASVQHLATELFNHKAGVKMTQVPYKGGGPAAIGLLAGEVGVMFSTPPSTLPHIKAGKLIALAVTTAQRDPALPDVPTVQESGLPGYDMYEWIGVLAPAGTPPEMVERMNAAIGKALATPEVKQGFANVGALANGSTPQAFGSFIKSELATWSTLVKQANIRAD